MNVHEVTQNFNDTENIAKEYDSENFENFLSFIKYFSFVTHSFVSIAGYFNLAL